jgi:CRISPR-associated protein Csd1
MILQALKEYYERLPESGKPPFGWKKMLIPFVIVLDANGYPVNIEPNDKERLMPQPVKKASSIQANVLYGNSEYTLGIACPKRTSKQLVKIPDRHEEFLKRVNSLGELNDEGLLAVRRFLAMPNKNELLGKFCEFKNIKSQDITFKLAGMTGFVVHSSLVKQAIDTTSYVKTKSGKKKCTSQQSKVTCLIAGELDELETKHTRIDGIWKPREAKTPDTLVGFNQNSFCSFKKSQGANAPIGKQAAFAFATALNTLLKKPEQHMLIGDATTVFWSAKQTKFEEDCGGFWSEPPKDDPDRLVKNVAALYKSVDSGAFVIKRSVAGESVSNEGDTRFYVLGLSPSSSRISVRFWKVGTVSEFAVKFYDYFKDLEIAHKPEEKNHLPIRWLLRSLVRKPSDIHKWDKQIPSRIAGDTMRSILEGLPFPETLLQAAILRVKAEREVSYPRAKLIKGCLNRKLRANPKINERSLKVSLDKENTDIGYRLGRLFAALEKIQQEAIPGINATICDRFYASASSTPRAVFGNLIRLNKHHLAKLENAGRRTNLKKLLGDIISKIPSFPAHLNLDEQGKFAIGYYHQFQDFFTKKSIDTSSNVPDQPESNL